MGHATQAHSDTVGEPTTYTNLVVGLHGDVFTRKINEGCKIRSVLKDQLINNTTEFGTSFLTIISLGKEVS